MKKRTIALFLVFVLAAALLCGCGGGGSGAKNSLCTDETILSKLKNDGTPEFVLDGVYYALPAKAEEFLKNGWAMTVDDYPDREVLLQAQERVDVTFAKDGRNVSAILANDSLVPLEAGKDCSVVQVSLYVSAGELPENYFVTKFGITPATSARDAKAVLKDKEGFKESSDFLYLTQKADLSTLDVLCFRSGKDSASVKIEGAGEFIYRRYKPLEEKAKEQAEAIAKYKAEAEAGSLKDYAEIITALDTKMTVPFASLKGTVVLKGTGNYEGKENDLIMGQDLSLYAVEDASGQIYCIFEGFVGSDVLKLPELAEGDVISLWGFASKITTFSDGYKAPTVITKILEKDGELIYLADDLKTK
ncbi:MAG: hypothetical protein IJL66_00550 [Lachnospiraceae bacterium]|nr:hypothetical protein [Lachnospiraceae bacterium]